MREDGIEPLALASYLAKIGTSDAIEPRLSLDVLAQRVRLEKIGRAPAHFDVTELATLNGKLLAPVAVRQCRAASRRARHYGRCAVLGRGAAESRAGSPTQSIWWNVVTGPSRR